MNAQLTLFDEVAPPPVAAPAAAPVEDDDGAEYWKVGMVTSLPMMANVGGVSRYVYHLAGIVESIDGGTACVRIYSHPAWTGHGGSCHHKQLATGVPIGELGRYKTNDHLRAVIDAGMLETGDLALIEARNKAMLAEVEEARRLRTAAELARIAARQEKLERGEFITSEAYEESFEWTRNNDAPAVQGEGRSFILATEKGAVQIDISFPVTEGQIRPIPWGSAAYGNSISETGYRSLLGDWRPTPDDLANPRAAAEHIAATLQSSMSAKPAAPKPRRSRSKAEAA